MRDLQVRIQIGYARLRTLGSRRDCCRVAASYLQETAMKSRKKAKPNKVQCETLGQFLY